VDYGKILSRAEEEGDIILWDGGNNDTPFYKPDIHIVVFDPHRAGHETTYHPGETNLIMADIAVINKVDSADPEDIERVKRTIKQHNPGAQIILADSEVTAEDSGRIEGKRVLVIEDGPTLTHGEMKYGAGIIAARNFGAAEIIDPRPYLQGSLKDTFEKYPGIGKLLPAMGYGRKQIEDLEATINNTDCDLVLIATPVDLTKLISINKPSLRVEYAYKDNSSPSLEEVLREKLAE
jgi:predicted GTPase